MRIKDVDEIIAKMTELLDKPKRETMYDESELKVGDEVYIRSEYDARNKTAELYVIESIYPIASKVCGEGFYLQYIYQLRPKNQILRSAYGKELMKK